MQSSSPIGTNDTTDAIALRKTNTTALSHGTNHLFDTPCSSTCKALSQDAVVMATPPKDVIDDITTRFILTAPAEHLL